MSASDIVKIQSMLWYSLFKAIRPKQWPKNLLIFAGLVFTNNVFVAPLLARSIAGFFCFCLLSGSLYLINDILDVEQDRQHPKKKYRPIPAGQLPIPVARIAAAIFGGIALVWAFMMDSLFGCVALGYFGLLLSYSFWLKHIVLIDVFVIAAGFVLRAAAGAVLISVKISPWLFVCTTLLALFLGLGKRRQELVLLSEGASNHRKILEEYSLEWIDQMISAITASIIVCYALYTFTSETATEHRGLMLTIPFVMYGLFRYLYLIHKKNMGGSPEMVLLEDRPMQANILLWILTSILILYLDGS